MWYFLAQQILICLHSAILHVHYLINHNLLEFPVLVLGLILGETNVVSQSEANIPNRMAVILLQPPLIFLLLS